MSMYDLIWGNRSQYYGEAKKILGEETHLGRFRDVWFEHIPTEDGFDLENLIVTVYTRNGGGNREDQQEAIDSMHAHPNFISDEDDSFDNTYAAFRFRFDIKELSRLTGIDKEELVGALHELDPLDTGERWRKGLAEMGVDVLDV